MPAAILSRITLEQIAKIKTRQSWPIPLLADILGCSTSGLYRLVQIGTLDIDVVHRGRITTRSILKALPGHNPSIYTISINLTCQEAYLIQCKAKKLGVSVESLIKKGIRYEMEKT